jgi:hypothetical protein
MTDRDWDAEMRKIDRQLASVPDAALTPATGAKGGKTAAGVAPSGAEATSTFGVFARLGLAVALGVAIVFWPYGARCGFGLAGYLAAVAVLVTAGTWSSIWTWRHRAARAHTLSLLLICWGLVLASIDVLPRVGYAKPTIDHPARWSCG